MVDRTLQRRAATAALAAFLETGWLNGGGFWYYFEGGGVMQAGLHYGNQYLDRSLSRRWRWTMRCKAIGRTFRSFSPSILAS